MNKMRYIGYGLLIVLLMSGCARRIRYFSSEYTDVNETEQPTEELYVQGTEEKYNLKPEPFSIDSNKKDPELLGPQSTIKREIRKEPEVTGATPAHSTSTNKASSMTKSECISMIGGDKFERYSKRFGGESGAIKRCAILKRLKRK